MITIDNFLTVGADRAILAIGWESTRRVQIAKFPMCYVCGYIPKRGNNDVHHIIPRHVNPALIHDPDNLVTVCTRYCCHLRFGHFGDYRRYWNPNIRRMVQGLGSDMRAAELLQRLSCGGGINTMDIEQAVLDIFSVQIGRQAQVGDSIRGYNLHRIAKCNICMKLDKAFGTSTDVAKLDGWGTVGDVVSHIVDLDVW